MSHPDKHWTEFSTGTKIGTNPAAHQRTLGVMPGEATQICHPSRYCPRKISNRFSPLRRETIRPHARGTGQNGGWGYEILPLSEQLLRSEERRVGKECRSWWSR